MSLGLIFLIIAVICFVFEAFNVGLGALRPKWWALGIAFYLLTQAT